MNGVGLWGSGERCESMRVSGQGAVGLRAESVVKWATCLCRKAGRHDKIAGRGCGTRGVCEGIRGVIHGGLGAFKGPAAAGQGLRLLPGSTVVRRDSGQSLTMDAPSGRRDGPCHEGAATVACWRRRVDAPHRPALGTIPRPATAARACVWYGFRGRQGQALVTDRIESGAWNRSWCDSGRH